MMLSIIMPAYNAEKTIDNSVNSVVQILDDNVELIIIDDGSTDNTYNKCARYCRKYSSIRLIKFQNSGVSNARNIGLDISCADYVMFVDSDDENLLTNNDLKILDSKPEFVLFSYLVKKQRNNKEYKILNTNTVVSKSDIARYIIDNYDLFSSPWGKIYKKDLIKKNNLQFIANQKYGEDTAFVLSYLSLIKNEILVSNIISYRYYLNSSSASGFKVYHKEINLYLYNVLQSYLKLNADKNCTERMANYLFDKAIMHYYLNNNNKNFKTNYSKTYEIFADYLNCTIINKEVLKYKFPLSESNIRYVYRKNVVFKLKNAIKKIIWR